MKTAILIMVLLLIITLPTAQSLMFGSNPDRFEANTDTIGINKDAASKWYVNSLSQITQNLTYGNNVNASKSLAVGDNLLVNDHAAVGADASIINGIVLSVRERNSLDRAFHGIESTIRQDVDQSAGVYQFAFYFENICEDDVTCDSIIAGYQGNVRCQGDCRKTRGQYGNNFLEYAYHYIGEAYGSYLTLSGRYNASYSKIDNAVGVAIIANPENATFHNVTGFLVKDIPSRTDASLLGSVPNFTGFKTENFDSNMLDNSWAFDFGDSKNASNIRGNYSGRQWLNQSNLFVQNNAYLENGSIIPANQWIWRSKASSRIGAFLNGSTNDLEIKYLGNSPYIFDLFTGDLNVTGRIKAQAMAWYPNAVCGDIWFKSEEQGTRLRYCEDDDILRWQANYYDKMYMYPNGSLWVNSTLSSSYGNLILNATDDWGGTNSWGNLNMSGELIVSGDFFVNESGGVNMTLYKSCTALETDAEGNLVCGSDAGGYPGVADDWVNETGDTMSGNLTMDDNWIVNFRTRLGWGNITGAPGYYGSGSDLFAWDADSIQGSNTTTANLDINWSLAEGYFKTLYVDNKFYMSNKTATSDRDAYIYFYDDGDAEDEWLMWDNANDRMTWNNDLYVAQSMMVETDIMSGGTTKAASTWWVESEDGSQYMEGNLNITDGTNFVNLTNTGHIYFTGNMSVNGIGVIWSNGTVEADAVAGYDGVADDWVNETGDTMTGNLTFSGESPRIRGGFTGFVNYNITPADDDRIYTLRQYQDETLYPAMSNQPDVPRDITVFVRGGLGDTTTGTINLSGLDADGRWIFEIITVNVAAAPAEETYNTSYAFGNLTKIVSDYTAGTAPFYSVGIGNKIGLPNRPLKDADDVFKITINGVPKAIPTVYPQYATLDVGAGTTDDMAGAPSQDEWMVWYRYGRE